MKTYILSSAVAGLIISLTFSSCSKDAKSTTNGDGKSENPVNVHSQRTLGDYEIPAGSSPELQRIYDDVLDADYEVAIIDNVNFGKSSSTPENDIILSGKTLSSDNISIVLNNTSYSPRSGTDGQWWVQGDNSLRNYIDADVNVRIESAGAVLKDATIHVPKSHVATKLGDARSLTIGRTGNTLRWTPDGANSTGKVILQYFLYSDDENALIEVDGRLLDDNGSYNIDDIIAPTSVQKIFFKLISGNTVSANVNGKKLVFYITTMDQHEYFIQ